MGLFSSLFGSKPKINVNKSIAQQQQAGRTAAIDTQNINAIESRGPAGSITFTRDGNRVTGQDITLAPNLQQVFGGASGSAAALSQFGPQTALTAADVPQGIDLASNFFNQQASLIAPEFNRLANDTLVNLTNRGLPVGSEAFNRGLQPIFEGLGLGLQQAAHGAVQLTPQEEQRQIGNAAFFRSLPFQEAGQALNVLNSIPKPTQSVLSQVGVQGADVLGTQTLDAKLKSQPSPLSQLLGAAGGLLTAPLGGTFLGGIAGAALPSIFGGR